RGRWGGSAVGRVSVGQFVGRRPLRVDPCHCLVTAPPASECGDGSRQRGAPSRVGEVVGPPRAAALPRAQGGADSVRQGQHPRGNGAGVGPDGPVDQGATSSTCVVYGGWAAGQAATSGVCLWSAGDRKSVVEGESVD